MSKPHWAYYLTNPGADTLNKADNIAWKRNSIAYKESQLEDEKRALQKMEAEFMDFVSSGKDSWTTKEISDAKIAYVTDKSELQIAEL